MMIYQLINLRQKTIQVKFILSVNQNYTLMSDSLVEKCTNNVIITDVQTFRIRYISPGAFFLRH